MTDQELIELVQQTAAEDLSVEQVEALRQAMLRTPALRDALVERLQMEQYLSHALGRVEVSLDRIFERAEAVPVGKPTMRLLWWGLATLVMISAGLGIYLATRPEPGAEQVAGNNAAGDDEKPAVAPAQPVAADSAEQKLADAVAAQPSPPPPAGAPERRSFAAADGAKAAGGAVGGSAGGGRPASAV